MGVIGGEIGYQILRRISREGENRYMDGSSFEGRSKLQMLLGPEIWDKIKGRIVIDFGCGHGVEAVELAQWGGPRM